MTAVTADAVTAERFPRPVICVWCNNRHRSSLPGGHGDGTQGVGCAASVFQVTRELLQRLQERGFQLVTPRMIDEGEVLLGVENLMIGDWLIQGHYGSKHDCNVFRFKRHLPAITTDPVCDTCVDERLHAGDLEQIEGHYL
jgi:hypothetical protein